MNISSWHMNRRTFILGTGAFAAGIALAPGRLLSAAAAPDPIRRTIPVTGEQLPVMGMGTSRTFDAGDSAAVLNDLADVMHAFFDHGGTLIDTSPMYGRAESVVGRLLVATGRQEVVFAATKVWTDGRENGMRQMAQSFERIGVATMDLMQIHNLRDWQTHLPVLREWRQQGRIRYIGITTSHGRGHAELEGLLRTEPFDFVQFSYNLQDRTVEERLLPLAADRGIAVLINRPFQRGDLFRKTRGTPLPEWSAEFDARSWGQFFLKFVIAHPAVTCVIPATSKAHHMLDNMAAGFGRLPDGAMRRRMVEYIAKL
ncbi:aldo/keto reductase [Desulfatitalea alkaliphila]|uniref:Aldo/keto reductase n=1 Tax=Desulfatitalea alkaliphila TaxID=2929485 RepID=A0AA41UK81_9BACT|nr:aldo/keto reductase [Desulfatitalea alkaliphila]MCJ8502034.1 aldo/keto reductase [Desulfatitalea alkaliphila]